MDAEVEKPETADSEQDEEEDVYEVERIIDMRLEEVTHRANELAGKNMAGNAFVHKRVPHNKQRTGWNLVFIAV